MVRYQTKSVLIGRKKGSDDEPDVRPCFINMFHENNPHKSGETPFEVVESERIHKVMINGLDISYLPPGNDLVINNLEYVDIEVEEPHITISGKHTN